MGVFLVGYLIILGTSALCLFLFLILALIQEYWIYIIIKVLGIAGLSLGIITILIGLYMNIIWCNCNL